ncbi:hypothetical protein [Paenibacillus dendritiformis]|uniref:hypothetical protein n=1 Tax=Paenibacillus dendritiformis TaxID=130049 RepID=UPI0035A24D40
MYKNDSGHPEVCPIYSYHQAFRKEGADEIYDSCSKGQIGCAACKQKIARSINNLLEPMRERRAAYLKHPGRIGEIMIADTEKARLVAKKQCRRCARPWA